MPDVRLVARDRIKKTPLDYRRVSDLRCKRLHAFVHLHFPPFEPAIDMARRSCPLEGFEQCDTVFDQLNDLNRRSLGHADSWDP